LGWFKAKIDLANIAELKNDLLAKPEAILGELGKELKQQEFCVRWSVLKEVLPLLDRNQQRALVRETLSADISALQALLDNYREREQAIECLGYLPSREVVQTLANLLGHKDDAVQLMAAGALQNHTPRLVVPVLIEGLLQGKVAVARAGEVLLKMGFYAQEMLMEAYKEASPSVKAVIIELIVLGDNPKCLPFVQEALEAKEAFLKKKALEAVEAFGFRELWTEVVMCLAEDDWSLRARAIEVLAKLQVTEALEFVEPFKNDADSWVRQCAIRYLESIQDSAGGRRV